MKNLKLLFVALIGITLTFTSCKKDEGVKPMKSPVIDSTTYHIKIFGFNNSTPDSVFISILAFSDVYNISTQIYQIDSFGNSNTNNVFSFSNSDTAIYTFRNRIFNGFSFTCIAYNYQNSSKIGIIIDSAGVIKINKCNNVFGDTCSTCPLKPNFRLDLINHFTLAYNWIPVLSVVDSAEIH